MDMEKHKIVFKGSHPDSLYRVAADSGSDGHKITRILRVIRWPIALIAICAALAAFVYFLMPENLDPKSTGNRTYWERVPAGVGLRMKGGEKDLSKDAINKLGNKPSEIDFYEAPNEKNDGLSPVTDPVPENTQRKLQIPPVYPAYVAPEVQYGNEKADLERRTAKFLEDAKLYNSTVKPHITQKPEKPLAIYFKDANELTTVTSETITRAETVNDFTNYVETNKNVNDPIKWNPPITKDIVPPPKRYISQVEHENNAEHGFYTRVLPNVNFTSGHSNLFGISIEDAEKMKSTTQNALYNTRVSPTLPTWRDRDDTTTKNYPNNYSDVQCTSTHMPLCRGVLPYDLAGVATKIGNLDMTSLLTQIEYLVSTNCSDRVRHFVCALLEPECSPPPYPQKMPCYNLCKAIMDSCDGHIPRELIPAFNCKLYPHANCMAPKTPCYNREFTCGEGSCIPRDWLCDGRKDCPGGEDEQKCTNCEANEYKCPAGGCIPKAWKCDGYKDCPGGDDESEGTCGARREPGEEAAASAPAHSVRRPHARPNAQRKHSPASQHNDNDSSKELLVTSYSSNGFPIKRTSAPSIHRLTPYNRSSTPSSRNQKKVNSRESLVPEYVDDDSETKKPQAVASKPILIENESVEDLNVGDLGFSDDLDRMEHSGSPKLQRQRSKFRPANRKAVRPKPQIDTNTEKKHEPVSFAANENKARNSNQINDENGMTPSSDEGADGDAKVAQEKRAPARTGDFDSGHHNSWSRAHASPCPSGELRCVDGRCITLAQLCDGTLDCSDHADEDNCYT